MGWDGMRWDEMGWDGRCSLLSNQKGFFDSSCWQPSSLRTPRLGDVKSQFNMVRKSAVHSEHEWTWVNCVKEIRHNNKCRSTRQSHEQNMVRMTRYGDNYFFLRMSSKKINILLREQILEQMEKHKIKPFGTFRSLGFFISRHDLQESGTSGLWITTTRPNRWSTCRTLSRCRKYGEFEKSGPWVSKVSVSPELPRTLNSLNDPIFAS